MGVAARVRERGAAPALESGAAGRARLSREGALQIEVGECELGLPGKARGHGELDPPDATTDQGTDLQQLQPDGAAGDGSILKVGNRKWPSSLGGRQRVQYSNVAAYVRAMIVRLWGDNVD